jgi:serine phosphatase RsbU (regulator of sigma subunit)
MDRGVLMLKEARAGQLSTKVVRVQAGALKTQNILISQSIVRTALERNAAVLISDIQSDEQFRGQVSVVQAHIHSAMCVPLWTGTDIMGLIYADRTALLGQFTEDDLRLLTLLANLAAVKYENARLTEESLKKAQMDRELDLAVQIQKNFLPKADPDFEPYDISGAARACSHVGGDYYDFISIDPSRLGLVIADVSGKGVSASLLMASLRASLHAEIPATRGLAALAAKLNNFVHGSTDTDTHSFISFFFGILDRPSGNLTYVNAGHNPPILLGRGGPKFLDSTGFCLGMFPTVSFETQTLTFEPGDILCLYTDGIVESRNREKEEFGLERLTGTLRKSSELPARDIKETVFVDVFGFTECAESSDDMTLMIVKRNA